MLLIFFSFSLLSLHPRLASSLFIVPHSGRFFVRQDKLKMKKKIKNVGKTNYVNYKSKAMLQKEKLQ